MSALQQIRLMFDYNYALYEQVWESVMTLSEEQFSRDNAYAHGSLRNQLLHVAIVDTRWIRGLQGDPDARYFDIDDEEYATRDTVRTFFQEAAGKVKNVAPPELVEG